MQHYWWHYDPGWALPRDMGQDTESSQRANSFDSHKGRVVVRVLCWLVLCIGRHILLLSVYFGPQEEHVSPCLHRMTLKTLSGTSCSEQ